jgi:glycosyltransferase involved in cell wall biosynthesis
MPKVLIITYYWPPSGGSSVLRWLKFVKYLREFGWEPIIYTPSNPESQEIDPSLLHDIPPGIEVITSPIREPYGIYKLLTGKKKKERLGVALMNDSKSRFAGQVMLWIRSNLFIPDPRRFWVRPSYRLLKSYLLKNHVDVVITTGPPHSMHLIGRKLHRKLGIKWVADFRDPWTNIDFYRELLLTRIADRCHHRLERTVLQEADHVITVSPGMTREFKSMGVSKVTTITNGYDHIPSEDDIAVNGKFSILHLGSLPKSRNPVRLWEALSSLAKESQLFSSMLEIRLIGRLDNTVKESIADFELQKYVVRQEYIPHEQTFELLTTSSVLLLCINNTPNAGGILTNKFFEYLSARRPIIAIGPVNGDASVILSECGAGKMFEYDDSILLKKHVFSLFELYSQQRLTGKNQSIEKFSRKNLTRELTELLNRIIA